MKDEIHEGVTFLHQFIAKYGQLNPTQIDLFASRLTDTLEKRYINHWYESNPMKGQAFRCLRLKRSEKYVDPTIELILKELGLTLNQLGLPNDFTLWIDPGEVSVRFGDSIGYTYTIAKLNKNSVPETKNQAESKLIVQNSEKIFDENLTAFIRQNSSNQDLSDVTFTFNDMSLESDVHSNLPIERRTISPPLQKRNNSSNISIQSLNSNQNNRLSYNDSCYFSSSSSSCASSLGSEDNFSNLRWLNNNSELFSNPINEQQEPNNLGFMNFDFMNNKFELLNNVQMPTFNSETSSDRSDTPNSSVTGSSYFNNFNFGFDGFFPTESLDSSSSSTSTTILTEDAQTPKKVSDSEEEKSKKSPKSNKKSEAKRDSSYCGYVESFPYYYKLNRLYNALALQKMQADRLKKAGLMSGPNNPVAVAQAIAALQTISPLGTSPNSQYSGSPPQAKPKQKTYNKNYKKYQYPPQQQHHHQQQQAQPQQLQQQAQPKFY